jgi:molybdopterin-guanine dinucleotide biosynthesis protein
MPDKLRAGGSFPFILEGDRTETQSPQFKIRVLSASDNDAVIELRDEFIAAKEKTDRRQIVGQILDRCVSEVLIEGYSTVDLQDLLTDRECWELISAAIEGAALTAEERKKYVSPPQFASEQSANDAVAETNA